MREIKFRAWDGYRLRSWDDIRTTDGFHHWIFLSPKNVGSEKVKLMQFTGLKDKNGKEIYEGDILSIACHLQGKQIYVKAVIEYQPGAFWFRGLDYNITDCNWHFYDKQYTEIIGNIYENPELLK